MAGALSRLGGNPKKENGMDSLVQQCLDFFFGKNQGIERKTEDREKEDEVTVMIMEGGDEEECEDYPEFIGDLSREGREGLVKIGGLLMKEKVEKCCGMKGEKDGKRESERKEDNREIKRNGLP